MTITESLELEKELTKAETDGINKARRMASFIASKIDDPSKRDSLQYAFYVNYPNNSDLTDAYRAFVAELLKAEADTAFLEDSTDQVYKDAGGIVTRQIVTIEDIPSAAYVTYLAQQT